jgi:hypothetical protein
MFIFLPPSEDKASRRTRIRWTCARWYSPAHLGARVAGQVAEQAQFGHARAGARGARAQRGPDRRSHRQTHRQSRTPRTRQQTTPPPRYPGRRPHPTPARGFEPELARLSVFRQPGRRSRRQHPAHRHTRGPVPGGAHGGGKGGERWLTRHTPGEMNMGLDAGTITPRRNRSARSRATERYRKVGRTTPKPHDHGTQRSPTHAPSTGADSLGCENAQVR